MVVHLNKFLDVLKSELPKICSDKDLIEHLPDIFKNPAALHRMRSRGEAPPFFHIPPHIHYLKSDILDWFRSRYKEKNGPSPIHKQGRKQPEPKSAKTRQVGAKK